MVTRRVAMGLLAMAMIFPFRASADPPLIEVRQEAYGWNESDDGSVVVVSEVQAFVGETIAATSDGGIEKKTRQFGCLEIRKRTPGSTFSIVNHGCGELTVVTDAFLASAMVSGSVVSEVIVCEKIPAGMEYCHWESAFPASIEVTAEFTASEDPAGGVGLCSDRPDLSGSIPDLLSRPPGIYRAVLSSWELKSPETSDDVLAEESAPVITKRTGIRSFYVDEVGLLTGNDDVGNPCLPQSSVSMPEI